MGVRPVSYTHLSAAAARLDSEMQVLGLSEVKLDDTLRVQTGIQELDRVLGGGIVPGSMILVGGDPGIGK